jgi:DNA-binding IclR family transcriptional regulator
LDSLEHYGLIERRNRLCYPTDRLPQLLSGGADLALKDQYRPVLEKINAALGELVVLARLKGSELVPLETVKTVHRIGFDSNGIVPAAYASEKTASGKLLLTQRPDLIRKGAPEKLARELELASKHHIAFNIEDSFHDMVAMATWVDTPSPTDPVVSVLWPLYRFNLEEAKKAIVAFREAVPDTSPLKTHKPSLDDFIELYPRLKDM